MDKFKWLFTTRGYVFQRRVESNKRRSFQALSSAHEKLIRSGVRRIDYAYYLRQNVEWLLLSNDA